MSSVEPIEARGVPRANGHYSHAVAHGGLVYVSGQLGRGPGMSDAEAGDVAAQTRRCLTAIAAILSASDSDLSRLLKVNAYITDIDHWPAVDAVYREMLGAHKPARAVLAVHRLHFGAVVEIDAIAARIEATAKENTA